MGEKYDDKGSLGSDRTDAEPFRDPQGLKRFAGFGADEADLSAGFVRPEIRDLPEYDKRNYEDRCTTPPTNNSGLTDIFEPSPDYAFRQKDRETKGFFTRPRLPTER